MIFRPLILWQLNALSMLVTLLVLSPPGFAEGSAYITLQQGHYTQSESALPPAADMPGWQQRQLPDNWTISQPDQGGKGWYLLTFQSQAVADPLWAVYLPNVNMTGDVYVNGMLIGSGGSMDQPLARNWFRPLLFEFPSELLHAGVNSIHIRVAAYPNEGGGVGRVFIGPAQALQPLYEHLWSIKIAPAMVMFVMMLVFAIMLAALAILRASDRKFLWLAGAAFCSALLCLNFFLRDIPISRHIWEAMSQLSVGMFVYCLMMFVNRFLELDFPRLEKACTAYFPILGTALIVVPELYQVEVYQLWQVGTLILATLMFALSTRQWHRTRHRDALVLATGLGLAALLGAHDLSVAELNLEYEQLYLFQFAPVAFLLLAAGLWITRLVSALNNFENLNRDLSRIIDDKSAALEEALNETRQASKAKTRFFAAASHDLRQPLNSIALLMSGLEEQLQDNRNIYLAGKIRQGIDHLRAMFEQLLDVSRLEAGAVEVAVTLFPIAPLLESIRLEYAPQFAAKGIALRSRSLDVSVFSDPALLERIVRNYLENALHYTDAGGILIGCRRRGENIRIEVWDTGRGISEVDQHAVFDEFKQLGAVVPGQGTGLGLAIVKQIAHQLQLGISVRSRLGYGSVFAVDVPVASVAAAVSHSADLHHSTGTELEDRRIWVVDDDTLALEGIEVVLESWGCLCRTFSNHAQLRSFMQQNCERPDMILSDFNLGEAAPTGADVIATVRAEAEPDTAAIIMTGEASIDMRLPGVPVLRKPIDPQTLIEAMRCCFRSVN